MSHTIPPMLSTTPPPLGNLEDEDEDDFGDFAAAEADFSFNIDTDLEELESPSHLPNVKDPWPSEAIVNSSVILPQEPPQVNGLQEVFVADGTDEEVEEELERCSRTEGVSVNVTDNTSQDSIVSANTDSGLCSASQHSEEASSSPSSPPSDSNTILSKSNGSEDTLASAQTQLTYTPTTSKETPQPPVSALSSSASVGSNCLDKPTDPPKIDCDLTVPISSSKISITCESELSRQVHCDLTTQSKDVGNFNETTLNGRNEVTPEQSSENLSLNNEINHTEELFNDGFGDFTDSLDNRANDSASQLREACGFEDTSVDGNNVSDHKEPSLGLPESSSDIGSQCVNISGSLLNNASGLSISTDSSENQSPSPVLITKETPGLVQCSEIDEHNFEQLSNKNDNSKKSEILKASVDVNVSDKIALSSDSEELANFENASFQKPFEASESTSDFNSISIAHKSVPSSIDFGEFEIAELNPKPLDATESTEMCHQKHLLPDDFCDFESAVTTSLQKHPNNTELTETDDFGDFEEAAGPSWNTSKKEDDFDDFADFSSASVVSNGKNSGGSGDWVVSAPEQRTSQVETEEDDFDDFESAEDTALPSQPLETELVTLLSQMFPSGQEDVQDIPIPPLTSWLPSEDAKDNAALWVALRDVQSTPALEFQWSSSSSHGMMLRSLGIDTRNILFGQRWNSSMPRYAANLGNNPLEPMKAELSSQSPGSPARGFEDGVPAAQFDWTGSGLVNPLDSASKQIGGVSQKPLDATTATLVPQQAPPPTKLSEAAQAVLASLPDLSFMRASSKDNKGYSSSTAPSTKTLLD